jgi:hypothetical protein
LKIDELTSELEFENNKLKKSFLNLSEQLSEANKMKNEFEMLLKNLESEQAQAKSVLQLSNCKVRNKDKILIGVNF